MLSIECPHCGLIKQASADQLPDHEISLKCPKCTNTFDFDPIVASLVAADDPRPVPPAATTPAPVLTGQPATGRRQEPTSDSKAKQPQRSEMLRIGELFSRSWQAFKNRIWTLLGIYLLGILLIAGAALLLQLGTNLLLTMFGGSMAGPAVSVLLMIGLVFLAGTWIAAASIYAIVEKTSAKKALGMGLSRIWAYLWLFSLLGLIICGGYGLLIIPGVLFTLWFFFAQYILAAEDTCGMDALLKSKEYVRGHGWAVFGRLLLLMLIFLPIGFIPLVGPFLSLLLAPFSLVYYNEIYQDLRQLKPDLVYPSSTGFKAALISLGIVGVLLVPVLAYFSAGPEARQAVSLLASMSAGDFQFQNNETELAEFDSQRQAQSPQDSSSTKQVVKQKNPLDDLMVYIYALNYKGKITLNGKEFYVIKGDPDMNYNYSTGGALTYGKNVFQVDYASLPDPWKLELRIKVYKPNWQTGGRTIFKEWLLEDSGGSKTFKIEINPEQVEKT